MSISIQKVGNTRVDFKTHNTVIFSTSKKKKKTYRTGSINIQQDFITCLCDETEDDPNNKILLYLVKKGEGYFLQTTPPEIWEDSTARSVKIKDTRTTTPLTLPPNDDYIHAYSIYLDVLDGIYTDNPNSSFSKSPLKVTVTLSFFVDQQKTHLELWINGFEIELEPEFIKYVKELTGEVPVWLRTLSDIDGG